jgi:hypothetical protein
MAYVYRNPIRQQLEQAKQQRATFEAERIALSQRLAMLNDMIAQWDAHIDAMTPLVENDPGQFLQKKSFAEICRIALENYGQWVTAQQVRGYLNQLGIELQYSNPMAVLHTTLQRVGQMCRDEQGNTFYAKKGLPLPPSPWIT